MLYLETFSSLLILQCKHTPVETGVSSKPILKLTSCRSSSAAFSGFLHTGISFWLHVTQAVAFNPLPPRPKKGKLILQLLVIQVQMANTLFLANRTHTSSTLYGLHGPESYSNTTLEKVPRMVAKRGQVGPLLSTRSVLDIVSPLAASQGKSGECPYITQYCTK